MRVLLLARGVPESDILSALGDMVLVRFVSPAITSPEPFGVVFDTPVSITSRRNLGLVARVLRDLTRGVFNCAPDPCMEPLFARFRDLGQTDLHAFFDKLLAIPPQAEPLIQYVVHLLSMGMIIVNRLVVHKVGLNEN